MTKTTILRREDAAEKIAVLIQDHMTSAGLSKSDRERNVRALEQSAPPPPPPCIHYDVRKVNPARLAPPPPDPPVAMKVSKGIGKIPPTKFTAVGVEDCRHEFRRISDWTPKGGRSRVRARCAKCKAEQIRFSDEVVAALYKRKGK